MSDQPESKHSELPYAEKDDPYPRSERPSFFHQFGKWVKQNLGSRHQDSSLKEVLQEVLKDHQDDVSLLPSEEKLILRNVLNFADIRVSDIMVPRTEIIAIEHEITLADLKKHIIENRHTRMPVYQDTLDNIEGFVHIKDLLPMLSGDSPFDLNAVMRPILFVPPSMKLGDLLFKMRLSGEHMTIVVDEYGGADGLVTMENLFEQIVGEIQDEHDEEEVENEMSWISENVMEIDSRMRIEKLEDDLGITFMEEGEAQDFETLGGLIFFHLGRVPEMGEVIHHPSGVKFEVLDADERRVKRVRVTRPNAAAGTNSTH